MLTRYAEVNSLESIIIVKKEVESCDKLELSL